MMTKSESKDYSKAELVELCIKEAWTKEARFVDRNGKKYIPDGYEKNLAKMTKAQLVEEYNALCMEE